VKNESDFYKLAFLLSQIRLKEDHVIDITLLRDLRDCDQKQPDPSATYFTLIL